MKGYEYQSDFAKKYVAQGVAQGLEQGVAQGRSEALAHGVLAVLQARGIAVPDGVRERILAQKDAARLDQWLVKAAVASSLGEVVEEPS